MIALVRSTRLHVCMFQRAMHPASPESGLAQAALSTPADTDSSASSSASTEQLQYALVPLTCTSTSSLSDASGTHEGALLSQQTLCHVDTGTGSAAAATSSICQFDGSLSLVQTILMVQSMADQDKFSYLTAALVRNKREQFVRQLQREILWGAILRAHAKMHPHLTSQERLARLRALLCTDGGDGSSLTEADLNLMNGNWTRYSRLMQSEADDWYWAANLVQLPMVAARKNLSVPNILNRDKLRALAQGHACWAHLTGDAKHNLWSNLLILASSAKELEELCAQQGQLPAAVVRTRLYTRMVLTMHIVHVVAHAQPMHSSWSQRMLRSLGCYPSQCLRMVPRSSC